MHRTRELITRASIGLFLVNGFEETTVDDIVLAAGVARRTFFRHFPTKEAVVLQFVDHAGQHYVSELAKRPANEAPLEALLATALTLPPTGLLEPGWAIPLNRLMWSTPALRAARLDRGRDWTRAYAEVFARRLNSPAGDPSPRLLAALGLAAMDLGTEIWVGSNGAVSVATGIRTAFASLGPLIKATTDAASVLTIPDGWTEPSSQPSEPCA